MKYAQPVPQNPLTGLREKIDEYWKEFLPTMYRGLKEAKRLDQSIDQAVEMTSNAYLKILENDAMGFDRAWELVKDQWAFPPPEPTARAPLLEPTEE